MGSPPTEQPNEPQPPEGRVVGWFRPDVSTRIWLFLPACILLTVAGALLVGYGYGRLERADPIGLHADARAFDQETFEGGSDEGGVGERPTYAPVRERGEGEDLGAMWLFFGLGLALVASGPGLAIFFLRRIWLRDDFLLLRTDGLVESVNGRTTTTPWDAIEAVRFDPDRKAIELLMREGSLQQVEPRLVEDGESLAKHLEDVRRKAIWNLLPQQRH